jgi:hypothetical protein
MMITVPIPDPCLSPNARCHWTKRNKAKNAAKGQAIAALFGVWASGLESPLVMNVRWFGKTENVKQLDDDNAWARLKATRDGLAFALGIDDRNIRQGTMEFAKDAANPRLEITLEAQ